MQSRKRLVVKCWGISISPCWKIWQLNGDFDEFRSFAKEKETVLLLENVEGNEDGEEVRGNKFCLISYMWRNCKV